MNGKWHWFLSKSLWFLSHHFRSQTKNSHSILNLTNCFYHSIPLLAHFISLMHKITRKTNFSPIKLHRVYLIWVVAKYLWLQFDHFSPPLFELRARRSAFQFVEVSWLQTLKCRLAYGYLKSFDFFFSFFTDCYRDMYHSNAPFLSLHTSPWEKNDKI